MSLELRRFGTTDLKVSRIGLGTVQLGMPYGLGMIDPPSDQEAAWLLHNAIDEGVNYFDTAQSYDRSESIVGAALAEVRPRPVIATKIGLPQFSGSETPTNAGKGLRAHVEAAVLVSLRNLQVDALDLVQLHSVEAAMLVPELLEAMESLTAKGWIRFWGASTYDEAESLAVIDSAPLSSLQVSYNLLDRRMERRLFDTCQSRKIALVFRSVFLKGVLSDRVRNLPAELQQVGREAMKAETIARQAGLTLAEMALRFAAYCPGSSVSLFGTSSIDETANNLSALGRGPLSADVIEALGQLSAHDDDLLRPLYTKPGWKL